MTWLVNRNGCPDSRYSIDGAYPATNAVCVPMYASQYSGNLGNVTIWFDLEGVSKQLLGPDPIFYDQDSKRVYFEGFADGTRVVWVAVGDIAFSIR